MDNNIPDNITSPSLIIASAATSADVGASGVPITDAKYYSDATQIVQSELPIGETTSTERAFTPQAIRVRRYQLYKRQIKKE